MADNGVGCGVLDLPDSEFVEVTGDPPDCMKMWFTAKTEIPGVQFNRHFEHWAQNWAQSWARLWAEFSTRALQA